MREVFPEAREGHCWFHKTANLLAALPKSAHPGAKKALAEIWGAEDETHALAAVKAFDAAFGTKFPRPPRRSPATWRKCWRSTTTRRAMGASAHDEPESTFATVRHRTKVTKGSGSRAADLAMAFKLIESAQDRWRAVNAPTSWQLHWVSG